jgi:hypothetical protein
MEFKVGDTVQCKQTRIDWVVYDRTQSNSYILKSAINNVEVPAIHMDLYFDKNLKLYQSLSHMIMKEDAEFLNLLASKLENHPIIDGLGADYIDRLRAIANNTGE